MLCALSIRALTIENCKDVTPMGRVIVRTVNAAPGSLLDLVLLAPARRSCVAVDLATNAILRVHHPRQVELQPFSVVRVEVSEPQAERLEQPEAIDVRSPLRPVGRILGMRCERLLRSIGTDADHAALGIPGPGISLWQLDGSRPSVEVLRVPSSTTISVDERGVRCRFRWAHGVEDLPVEDTRLLRQLDWLPSGRLALRDCAPALGFRPSRMTVALSRPSHGYCYKVIASLLP